MQKSRFADCTVKKKSGSKFRWGGTTFWISRYRGNSYERVAFFLFSSTPMIADIGRHAYRERHAGNPQVLLSSDVGIMCIAHKSPFASEGKEVRTLIFSLISSLSSNYLCGLIRAGAAYIRHLPFATAMWA